MDWQYNAWLDVEKKNFSSPDRKTFAGQSAFASFAGVLGYCETRQKSHPRSLIIS